MTRTTQPPPKTNLTLIATSLVALAFMVWMTGLTTRTSIYAQAPASAQVAAAHASPAHTDDRRG